MPGVEKGKRGVLKVCSGQFRPIAYAVRFKNGHCVGVVEVCWPGRLQLRSVSLAKGL